MDEFLLLMMFNLIVNKAEIISAFSLKYIDDKARGRMIPGKKENDNQ